MVIDRFEGEYAICETDNGSFLEVRLDVLPEGAREGDVVKFSGTEYVVDKKATEKRHKAAQILLNSLFK